MLRKILFWIAIKLRLRKPDTRVPIDIFKDLLPMIFGITIIIGAVKYLFPEGLPPLPWYIRLWRKLRWKSRKLRLAIIGW